VRPGDANEPQNGLRPQLRPPRDRGDHQPDSHLRTPPQTHVSAPPRSACQQQQPERAHTWPTKPSTNRHVVARPRRRHDRIYARIRSSGTGALHARTHASARARGCTNPTSNHGTSARACAQRMYAPLRRTMLTCCATPSMMKATGIEMRQKYLAAKEPARALLLHTVSGGSVCVCGGGGS
jgi:hypothetical protein